jgi:hypothetical protein
MADRFGLSHLGDVDPVFKKPTWRWRVETDEGNRGGGYFA